MASKVASGTYRPNCIAESQGGVAIGAEWGETYSKRPFRTGNTTQGNAVSHEVHQANGPLDQGRRHFVIRIGVFG
jgi:hypothetical protein